MPRPHPPVPPIGPPPARRLLRLLAALLLPILAAPSPAMQRSLRMQFTGPDAALERAIEADDPAAVDAAVAAGANPNARGTHGVTPLSFAVGTRRKRAAQALVRHRADPNLKDVEGDNAVTLAVTAYARDPDLLRLVLDAGGDPNTRRADGAPVIKRFGNDRNLPAITFLHARGADIDAEDDGQPLVAAYGISDDWDVVWHLITLGARIDTPRLRDAMVFAFNSPNFPSPDSPLYPYKVKVWRHVKAHGIDAKPPIGMTAG